MERQDDHRLVDLGSFQQLVQVLVERDVRAGPTVQVTRGGRGRVATRTTRLEYAEVLLLLDQNERRGQRKRHVLGCMYDTWRSK
jgi:hypothetical protein